MAPFDGTQLDTQFKTEQVVKPGVFSLEGLIAWLETQDPKTEYSFCDTAKCVLGRYVKARGGSNIRGFYKIGDAVMSVSFDHDKDADLLFVAQGRNAHLHRTFGDALARARKLLAARGAL